MDKMRVVHPYNLKLISGQKSWG